MAVRSSMALEDPPAADWPDDFLAFLVGRLDDMVVIAGLYVTGVFNLAVSVLLWQNGHGQDSRSSIFMSHVNR